MSAGQQCLLQVLHNARTYWTYGTAAQTTGLLVVVGARERSGSSRIRLSGPLTRSRTSPSSHLAQRCKQPVTNPSDHQLFNDGRTRLYSQWSSAAFNVSHQTNPRLTRQGQAAHPAREHTGRALPEAEIEAAILGSAIRSLPHPVSPPNSLTFARACSSC